MHHHHRDQQQHFHVAGKALESADNADKALNQNSF